ncbi:type ISP restriction/modification enzyme [Helicobacter cinaedi]|uniref:site-specific DNA-methyltransferase (adenine-specific) n=1 Tax=Helicobacter cinaedi TaxID=213 RepID=A0A377JN19_9HELI|nr:type ISP restriction/modification enzyme [Helicobacter cinaedi]STP08953.1 adenine specific DNA methyltransferase [Helicobacter cinaedi]
MQENLSTPNILQATQSYKQALLDTAQLGKSNEHSYRTQLQNLLNALKPLPIRIIHEPQAEVGQGSIRPDFKVYKQIDSATALSYNALVGFIECKEWGKKLELDIKGKQIEKYLAVCPNILLTDYNRFILISFGNVIDDVTLFPYGIDANLLAHEQESHLLESLNSFQHLLYDFFNASYATIKSKQELVNVLSTQSFYLGLKARESYHSTPRTSFHKFFEKTYETFGAITRYGLSIEEFCDLLGQSVVYGLLVAYLESELDSASPLEYVGVESIATLLPKEFHLLSEFIYFSIPSFHIPEPVSYALENIKKTIALIDKPALATMLNTQIESISIYLYEDFLKAYDDLRGSEKRKEGGVFYTPEPIINCICSSVHSLLKSHFNKPKGFLDSNVKVLDFATGTGSFLAKVFELILDEEKSRVWQQEAIREKFLKDIYGFELSFVPYIVAHIKLSSILKSRGFSSFDSENKLQIFLTNTLDLSIQADYKMTMPLLLLEEQDKLARRIKHTDEVLVIMGNPPYYQNSKNNLPEIINLLATYKPSNEQNIQPLNNDYIKFMRFAQWKLLERYNPAESTPLVLDSRQGIMGFITPNSYIWGRTHRKMRESLYNAFDRIYIINLHGDSEKDRKEDENVFDIRVGVCISLFIKYPEGHSGDSSLGNHSSDFVDFRTTADLVSSSALKSTKSPTSTTANTRIVDSVSLESQADSTIAKVAKHDFATIKLNSGDSQSETPTLKASSGGGYIRGRGDFACSEANPHLQIQTPPPYEKKFLRKENNGKAKLQQQTESKIFYFSTSDNAIYKRADKYALLNDIAQKGLDSISWQQLECREPYFWFIKRDLDSSEYEDFWALAKDKALGDSKSIFETASSGIKFRKDNLLVQVSQNKLQEMLADMQKLNDSQILAKYHFNETADWNLTTQRQYFTNPSPQDMIQVAYRPFDNQFCYYPLEHINKIIPRGDSRKNMALSFLLGENLGLCFTKDYTGYYEAPLIADSPIDIHYNGGQSYIAPLYRYEQTTGDDDKQTHTLEKLPNFTEVFKAYCQTHKILKSKSPEQILHFIYANLFHPHYRAKYAQYLRIGFPRINFEVSKKIFEALESIGRELVELHLLRKIPQDSSIYIDFRSESKNANFTIQKRNATTRFIQNENGVYELVLNDDLCIKGVNQAVYDYTIGGYKVIEKWLSYRSNYTCSKLELEHLESICKILKRTIALQKELEQIAL